MSHMYYDTFITVASDFAGAAAKIPVERGGKKTVALMQYEMLIDEPFVHTQEDILFSVWLERQDLGPLADDEIEALRTEYFATGRACLRASPLTKTHGWGVAFDSDGRAAIVAVESAEYEQYASDTGLEVVAAMRSKRA